MLNYIYKLFKSLWNYFFGSNVELTTKSTMAPKSSSYKKSVTKMVPKQHDFYLDLANKLKEPTGVDPVFTQGVWEGTNVSTGLKEVKSRLLAEKGRMDFLENNILYHKQKGIDWYFAPNRFGRYFNLSSGGWHQQAPLTSAEKDCIKNDEVCKQNFAVIFEIFLKLHHDSTPYYETRVEKFFSAAYDFYQLDQDPTYRDLMDFSTRFFKQYAKRRQKGYSKYLDCTISEFSDRLSQKVVSIQPPNRDF